LIVVFVVTSVFVTTDNTAVVAMSNVVAPVAVCVILTVVVVVIAMLLQLLHPDLIKKTQTSKIFGKKTKKVEEKQVFFYLK